MTEERPLTETTAVLTQPETVTAPRMNVFIGQKGLRAGWRLLVYLLILIASSTLINFTVRRIAGPPRGIPGPTQLLLQEMVGFALAFGTALIMSRIERRRAGEYGLPAREMFGKKFWLGMLFGLAEITVLMGLISAFGGYSFGTLALQGNEIFRWGLFHLVLFTMVGLYEEFLFRGYMQYTLADGIGFWPAAIVLSILFGGMHLGNPGEGLVGAAGVLVVGLLFCFTLKRTGNLWYAVGLHASFDWGETYLFSVPNSGVLEPGHLSNAVWHGPKWLTGGTVGPEGSVFCFLTLGLQFLVVMWLFPAKKSEGGGTSEAQN
ncbi:MAG TPA: type II CAAX endopeptidase family protein [Candidatus Sulfotelmatobacter sp.]|nr:type II CAAX endopeptidase family protein [Candidatus Sulfotelmatobacter sp.]